MILQLLISDLKPSDTYQMTDDAKEKLIELSEEIIEYGFNYTERVRNFTDIIYSHLIKSSNQI